MSLLVILAAVIGTGVTLCCLELSRRSILGRRMARSIAARGGLRLVSSLGVPGGSAKRHNAVPTVR
jgi:hypothetical protein